MKQKVALFLQFAVSYVNSAGDEGIWNFYAKLYPSGTIKVFDPAFRAADCETKNYFSGKVSTSITNKGNRYFNLISILQEFVNIAVKQCFFPFAEVHYRYTDPYIPRVEMSVKFDKDLYEKPIQIKADYKGKWMTADSVNKHLVVDAHYTKRILKDE